MGPFYAMYSPLGHNELDMTERLSLSFSFLFSSSQSPCYGGLSAAHLSG